MSFLHFLPLDLSLFNNIFVFFFSAYSLLLSNCLFFLRLCLLPFMFPLFFSTCSCFFLIFLSSPFVFLFSCFYLPSFFFAIVRYYLLMLSFHFTNPVYKTLYFIHLPLITLRSSTYPFACFVLPRLTFLISLPYNFRNILIDFLMIHLSTNTLPFSLSLYGISEICPFPFLSLLFTYFLMVYVSLIP